ncbi:MAG: chemotaxis protein CheD [Syntrophorhabdales bacterium]|jgi:chemotaxis protein CheD
MKIFLKPGELCVCDRPTQVSTILGSCIAVTIFNQRLRVGAICHALLPKNPKGHDALRYVDSAISSMLQKLEAMGIGKNEMEVKLLGGADVLERTGTTQSVGQKNIETALEIITQEDLNLAGSDVGGRMGRKLHFYTHTGMVLFTRIKRIPHEQD